MFATLIVSVNVSAESYWDMQISAERIQQSFSGSDEEQQGDADIDTITLSPGWQTQNWSITLSLPWQQIEGRYFINNVYPNIAFTCSQINSLSNVQKLILVRQSAVTLDQVQYCSDTGGKTSSTIQDSVSGWYDIEVFSNYYLPLNSDLINISAGIGYQHDNGNEDKGLGNGARQLFAETAWYIRRPSFNLGLRLGYYHVIKNNSTIDLQDYGYGSMNAGWHILNNLTLSAEYHYQQSNNYFFNDYDYLTYNLYLQITDHWATQAFITDYLNQTGFPDQELGGSISYYF
jgi:hypothetical protein